MAESLTNLAGGTIFRPRFLTGNSRKSCIQPKPNVIIINNRNTPKASMHAVIEDEPLVKTAKRTRPITLYDVLNVNRDATVSEIKLAYRRLAKRYHPDAANNNNININNDDGGGGDECGRGFIEIHEAYVTLCDPTRRAMYDLRLGGGSELGVGGFYGSVVGRSVGFYVGRRWETDQCW